MARGLYFDTTKKLGWILRPTLSLTDLNQQRKPLRVSEKGEAKLEE